MSRLPHCGHLGSTGPDVAFVTKTAAGSSKRATGRAEPVAGPSDVIPRVMIWRLRYRLTLQDRSEIVLQREIVASPEAVRRAGSDACSASRISSPPIGSDEAMTSSALYCEHRGRSLHSISLSYYLAELAVMPSPV
jgi:hypothetical protein